jgi:hypothetical protein
MTVQPDLRALAAPLERAERGRLRRVLAELLEWQDRLGRFPRAGAAPDATPVVSLYSNGRLTGCTASNEGRPGERVHRAFLLALGDARFGGIEPAERAKLTAQIAYPIRARRVSLDAAPRIIAPGAHGVALASGPRLLSLLVPDVAREHELDAEGLLTALEHKLDLPRHRWPPGGLFVFETDRVIARRDGSERTPAAPTDAAVRWLSERVEQDGAVRFGLDPRAASDEARGAMHHGRAAVVVQALAMHDAGKTSARRALRWLEKEIARALSGEAVDGWPEDAAGVAGTLALAKLAGARVAAPLRELARRDEVAAHPWHAAQVACALGEETPAALWNACVRSLERDPRAPWIALAAARRDDSVLEHVCTALAACVREHGPHRGGVGFGAPELALTAVTVEALSLSRVPAARRACELAREFLEKNQLLSDSLPEARDPDRVHGAFPLTPVHPFLRSDVTAHALIALGTAAGRA